MIGFLKWAFEEEPKTNYVEAPKNEPLYEPVRERSDYVNEWEELVFTSDLTMPNFQTTSIPAQNTNQKVPTAFESLMTKETLVVAGGVVAVGLLVYLMRTR